MLTPTPTGFRLYHKWTYFLHSLALLSVTGSLFLHSTRQSSESYLEDGGNLTLTRGWRKVIYSLEMTQHLPSVLGRFLLRVGVGLHPVYKQQHHTGYYKDITTVLANTIPRNLHLVQLQESLSFFLSLSVMKIYWSTANSFLILHEYQRGISFMAIFLVNTWRHGLSLYRLYQEEEFVKVSKVFYLLQAQ